MSAVAVTDALMKAQAHLTDRDHQLMDWLYDHGVLTTPQIAHALYPSLDFAQKRLTKLVALRVIDRFRPQRPGGGSYSFHYVLDQLGTDIVTAQRPDEEPPRRGQVRARRWSLTNRANLPHLLGINEFFTDLAGHARTHPNTRLERWWSTSQCTVPGRFNSQFGGYDYLPVRPDGHGIWAEHDQVVRFWLEYDTGTEPLPILTAKVTTYTDRLTAKFRDLLDWPMLFSLHSSGRQLHFHQRLAHLHPRIPIATTARDQATGRSVAEDVWWLHGHPSRYRLAALPDAIHNAQTRAHAPEPPPAEPTRLEPGTWPQAAITPGSGSDWMTAEASDEDDAW